ncbi:MAG: alanine--tRNA ligase [Kangiellaceae bacterium]
MTQIMTSNEIREAFLTFFESKGHQRVPSGSLVPGNDPTLLFTNAGMVPFKDCFLGSEKRSYIRATSSQKCVRAGGKHNDLENVGYTARHHTFFEMLGNFSFGDYFKKEAIAYAWEFLTVNLGLPAEKLWITIHEEDTEAKDIWFNDIGIDQSRFSMLGDKDNYWSMGDTGPCGPCSEIFYDHGSSVEGGPPGTPEEDGDRYIEIWNLVFMQFNRDAKGELHNLPKPSVDTGMGLERISAVMQRRHNNYDIDLFANLISYIADILNVKNHADQSLRVIADHIRSCSFLILDGVLPGNEGRGYVLRRIIRRAIRHGNKLGAKTRFFYLLFDGLVEQMGEAYPELHNKANLIKNTLEKEEAQFAKTLEQGMRILNQAIDEMKENSSNKIDGEILFKLYDTYGFPIDLTADIAREKNLQIDTEGFDKCMQAQKERARSANKFSVDYNDQLSIDSQTTFLGYSSLNETVNLESIIVDGGEVDAIVEGTEAALVLDKTPFYAESGGQVGDTGLIQSESGAVFEVTDTIKLDRAFIHKGILRKGTLKSNSLVETRVNSDERKNTANNHSATHLLHASLIKLLGEHVEQKGSHCDSQRLRFDFSHPSAISQQELYAIEKCVNYHIRANHTVETQVTDMESAKDLGATMLFGEKYGELVRVLSMSEFSVELCGGTHVKQTGQIGAFKIISEQGIASGIRRIEAITGENAIEYTQKQSWLISQLASSLKTDRLSLNDKVDQLILKSKSQDREIDKLKSKLSSSQGSDLLNQVQRVGDVNLLSIQVENLDAKSLRGLSDQIRNKMGSGIILLASVQGEKVSAIAVVTKDLVKRYHAGNLMRELTAKIDGKGGGRPDMAQGGGTNANALPAAISWVKEWVEAQK